MPDIQLFHKSLDYYFPIPKLLGSSSFEDIQWGEEKIFLNLRGDTPPLTSIESFLLLKELLRASLYDGVWKSLLIPKDREIQIERKDMFSKTGVGLTTYNTAFDLTLEYLASEDYIVKGILLGADYYGPTKKLGHFYHVLTKPLRER